MSRKKLKCGLAKIEATVLNNLTLISKAEICKILPDVSPTTVEVAIRKIYTLSTV